MKILLLIALVGMSAWMQAQTASTVVSSESSWNHLVDEFFDGYYKLHPSDATTAGFHEHDSELEDYSQRGINARIAFSQQNLARFKQLDLSQMPLGVRQDRQLILNKLQADLLELQDIRMWEKDPDKYSSGITQSAYGIMARKFAPPEVRLRSLVEREKQMPSVLVAARENLKNPPRIYTEIAVEQLPGLIDFFGKDVPAAFRDVSDTSLLKEFQKSNGEVISRLRDYQKFLQETALPNSHGDFRIGADNYSKKLLYEEMVDTPLDRLLEIGYEDLHRNQQRFAEVAAQIDPKKPPQQILTELQKDHPAPDRLLQAFRDDLGGIRQYILDKHIVTIPTLVPPTVEETLPFERATTFASMDTPGPFEKVATEAFFNVTLPESTWPKEQIESYMAQFNRNVMVSVAVHEVYPGHYVQFLWVPSAPSKVRKLLGCSSNAEGWAHYSEQMMLDEGYGNNDPKLRLGQLQDALLRDARYIVGISMHTGKMTFAEAVDFFQKEGYQASVVGTVEAKRGTGDPTYLVYTLGKLQIFKLREDYKKKMGANFSLQEFHDSFLKSGFPPIKIVRQTMLGDDGPVL